MPAIALKLELPAGRTPTLISRWRLHLLAVRRSGCGNDAAKNARAELRAIPTPTWER